jgi:hypothetical protein
MAGNREKRLINLWIDARDADAVTEAAHSRGLSRAELLRRMARKLLKTT